MKFKRITVNSKQMDGVPCIRGLRLPVATVVGMVADGMKEEEILKAYPDLEGDDIREAPWGICCVPHWDRNARGGQNVRLLRV